jgi:hypothetical protein
MNRRHFFSALGLFVIAPKLPVPATPAIIDASSPDVDFDASQYEGEWHWITTETPPPGMRQGDCYVRFP